MKEWIRDIQVGCTLRPKELWNASNGFHDQLPDQCIVLKVLHNCTSQSKTLISVKAISGHTLTLDAWWFMPPDDKK